MAQTKPNSNSKQKPSSKTKVSFIRWDTTDEEEITKRKVRAEHANYRIENVEPTFTYFGTYRVVSVDESHYCVELRSLSENINNCSCPDFLHNQLGTCKHIEYVLLKLAKRLKQIILRMSVYKNVV